jgi:hypothetical protein
MSDQLVHKQLENVYSSSNRSNATSGPVDISWPLSIQINAERRMCIFQNMIGEASKGENACIQMREETAARNIEGGGYGRTRSSVDGRSTSPDTRLSRHTAHSSLVHHPTPPTAPPGHASNAVGSAAGTMRLLAVSRTSSDTIRLGFSPNCLRSLVFGA